jgi:hypothetical protein
MPETPYRYKIYVHLRHFGFGQKPHIRPAIFSLFARKLALFIEIIPQVFTSNKSHDKGRNGNFKKVQYFHDIRVARNFLKSHEFLFAFIPICLFLEYLNGNILFRTVLFLHDSFVNLRLAFLEFSLCLDSSVVINGKFIVEQRKETIVQH